jgi:hypothetical protein
LPRLENFFSTCSDVTWIDFFQRYASGLLPAEDSVIRSRQQATTSNPSLFIGEAYVNTPVPSETHPSDGGKFRPTSLQDFSGYAKDLQTLLSLPLRRSQELLAQIYGFAGTYQLRAELKNVGLPGPFDDRIPADESAAAQDERLARADSRAERVVELVCDASEEPKVDDWYASEIFKLAPYLGLFETPRAHRKAVAFVKQAAALIREQGWSAVGAMRLLTLFEPSFEYEESNLSADSFLRKLSPLDYLREQRDYRWPDIFLEFPPERDLGYLGAADVSALAASMPPIDECHPEGPLAEMLACERTWESYVCGPLYAKFHGNTRLPAAGAEFKSFPTFLPIPTLRSHLRTPSLQPSPV